MAEEIVFGVRIRGDAAGAVSAVNQAVSAVQRMDAKLRQMATRAVGSALPQQATPSANATIEELKGSKELGAWQQQQELKLLKTRLDNAKKVFVAQKAAADKYYNDVVVPQQKKVAQLEAKIQARGTKGSTPTQQMSLGKQQAKLGEYEATYMAKAAKAEETLAKTVAAYMRKATSIAKAEYRAREQEAERSTKKQAEAHQRLVQQQQSAARGLVMGVNRSFNSMTKSVTEFGNASRLLTQGFSEITRALTMFVAVPLGAFLGSSAKAAIDFEAAMVRVGKTTEMLNRPKQFEELTRSIREIAKYTSSSHVQLAEFAEQFGQVGVTNPYALERLIMLSEKLATATDLAADTVAKDMGRIAAAFGLDLNTEQGVDTLERMGNVINKLENTTASSAGEIVEGLLNVASLGGMLKMPVDQMAAVVAMMESMGVAADAVGNRLNRFYQQMISKPQELAEMMEGFTSSTGRYYESAEDVLDAISNRDTVIPLLQDVVEAMSRVDDVSRSKALQEWFDVFGQVGGKVGVLAGNTAGLGKALKTAHDEFMNGSSLFYEYDKALQTSDAHMKILRNNVNDAAVTVGATFLPIINRLIEYAIPGIQMLAKAFEQLSWKNKLLIVGIPILAVVLLPLLFIFTQLAHGASMVVMGFLTIVRASMGIGVAISGIFKIGFSLVKLFGTLTVAGGGFRVLAGGLAPVLAGLGSGFLGVAAAIAAVVGGGYLLLKALASTGVDVAAFFNGLAESAKTWGENMMATFSGGLIGGALNYLAQALSSIASMIAGFFEAHSPPKKGPLKTIDRWGTALFTTYLRGFKNADFGILSEVGGMIRSILGTLFTGEDAEETINKMLATAREGIAKLLSIFNKTGKISEEVLKGITKGLGGLGPEVGKLLRLWVQYEASQRRLQELEEARKKVNKDYEAEVARIAAMNISAEEKAAKIRAAMNKRNSAVDRIDEETEKEKEKSEQLKEQLDWQKAFIQAQIDQNSMFSKLAKAIDKLGGAMEDLAAGGLGFGEEVENAMEEAKKKIDDTMTTIRKRIESAGEAVRAFFRGLHGERFIEDDTMRGMMRWGESELDPEAYAEMRKAYDLGKKIFDLTHPKGGLNINLKDNPIVQWIDAVATRIGTLMTVSSSFERLAQAVERLGTAWERVFGGKLELNIDVLGIIGSVLVGLLELVLNLGGGILNALAAVLEMAANIIETFIGHLLYGVQSFIGLLVGLFDTIVGLFKGIFTGNWAQFQKGLQGILQNLGMLVGNLVALLVKLVVAVVVGIADAISSIGRALGLTLLGWLSPILTKLFGPEAVEKAKKWLEDLPKILDDAWDAVRRWFEKAGRDFTEWVSSIFNPKKGGRGGSQGKRGLNSIIPQLDMNQWLGVAKSKLRLALTKLGRYLEKNGPAWLGKVGDLMGEVYRKLGAAFAGLGGKIKTWLAGTQLGKLWDRLLKNPLGTIGDIWETSLKPLFASVMTGMGTWFVSEAIPWLTTKWQEFRDSPLGSLAGLWETYIQPLFNEVWAGIETWFTTNFPIFSGKWDAFRDSPLAALKGWWDEHVKAKFDEIWNGVTTWFTETITNISAKWEEFRDNPVGILKNWWPAFLLPMVFGPLLALAAAWLGGTLVPDLAKKWEEVRDGPSKALSNWWEGFIKPKFDAILGSIRAWWDANITPLFTGKWGEVKDSPNAAIGTNWWESIKPPFDGVLSGAKTWFTETLIPYIQEQWALVKNIPATLFANWWELTFLPVFTTVWNGIVNWFTMNTPLMLLKWNLFRDTFMTSFQEIFWMVASVFATLMAHPDVVAAMNLLRDQFYAKGAEFAGAFGKGITSVTAEVVDAMRGIVDSLIIDITRAMAAVDDLIDKMRQLAKSRGMGGALGGLGGSRYGESTGLAAGGIVTKPILSLIGEGPEPEAVIPLSKLPALLGGALTYAPETGQIIIQINNPDFRDESNMRKVLREVRKDLTSALRDQKRMRGRS